MRGVRGEGLRREEHLLGDSERHCAEELRHTVGVVRHAHARRSDREGRVAGGDDEVAGEGKIARRSPGASLDRGDHWEGCIAHRAYEVLHG